MSPARKAKRPARRGVAPGVMNQVIVAAKRDYELARERYESTVAVFGSHTLWEHEDGRDLCDMDGDAWPCSTVVGIAFIYGVAIPEQWELTPAERSSSPVGGTQ